MCFSQGSELDLQSPPVTWDPMILRACWLFFSEPKKTCPTSIPPKKWQFVFMKTFIFLKRIYRSHPIQNPQWKFTTTKSENLEPYQIPSEIPPPQSFVGRICVKAHGWTPPPRRCGFVTQKLEKKTSHSSFDKMMIGWSRLYHIYMYIYISQTFNVWPIYLHLPYMYIGQT